MPRRHNGWGWLNKAESAGICRAWIPRWDSKLFPALERMLTWRKNNFPTELARDLKFKDLVSLDLPSTTQIINYIKL